MYFLRLFYKNYIVYYNVYCDYFGVFVEKHVNTKFCLDWLLFGELHAHLISYYYTLHSHSTLLYREATPPKDPLPTKIKESMRAGAVGRSKPRESVRECHFSPLRGAVSPNGESSSPSLQF